MPPPGKFGFDYGLSSDDDEEKKKRGIAAGVADLLRQTPVGRVAGGAEQARGSSESPEFWGSNRATVPSMPVRGVAGQAMSDAGFNPLRGGLLGGASGLGTAGLANTGVAGGLFAGGGGTSPEAPRGAGAPEPTTPAGKAAQEAQIAAESREPRGNPELGPVATLLGNAFPGRTYSGWGRDVTGQGPYPTEPTGGPGGTQTGNPQDRLRAIFGDLQANAPNMGWDQAGQLAHAQLGTAAQQFAGEQQERLHAMDIAGRLAEAGIRYRPEALHSDLVKTLVGAMAGGGQMSAGNLKRSLAALQEVAPQLSRFGVGTGMYGQGNPLQQGAAGGGPQQIGIPPSTGAQLNAQGQHPNVPIQPLGGENLSNLADVEQFLSSHGNLLPKEFVMGGDAKTPGTAGKVESFGPQHAAPLLNAIASSGLKGPAIHDLFDRLTGSPAGASLKSSVMQQLAQDELRNYMMSNKVPTDPQGATARNMVLAGSPFQFGVQPRSALGQGLANIATSRNQGVPYNEAQTPGGAAFPIDYNPSLSRTLNPFTPSQAQMDRDVQLRLQRANDIYEALGLRMR
jgi:hypothetical protein